jgi:hypothetical protein
LIALSWSSYESTTTLALMFFTITVNRWKWHQSTHRGDAWNSRTLSGRPQRADPEPEHSRHEHSSVAPKSCTPSPLSESRLDYYLFLIKFEWVLYNWQPCWHSFKALAVLFHKAVWEVVGMEIFFLQSLMGFP